MNNPVEDIDTEEFSLDLSNKKKKKKSSQLLNPTITEDEPDYTYTELLARVYGQLREKNPTFSTVKRYVIPPPQLNRVGTRRTMWANFFDIAKAINRQPDSIMQFILAELGTDGSIDGNNRFLIKGKYAVKDIESLLRKYIGEYVTCTVCRKPNTTLERDPVTRLFFVQCDDCQARRCVAPIKAGFHAVLKGERKKVKMQE
jgi:translation initiation factor 2 subunit 2